MEGSREQVVHYDERDGNAVDSEVSICWRGWGTKETRVGTASWELTIKCIFDFPRKAQGR